jgi:hypothetical protein
VLDEREAMTKRAIYLDENGNAIHSDNASFNPLPAKQDWVVVPAPPGKDTHGKIYYQLKPLSNAEIRKRGDEAIAREKRRRESSDEQMREQNRRLREQPVNAPRTPAASSSSGSEIGAFQDAATAREREANSLDKVFCGGVSASGSVAGQEVAGGRIGGRECEDSSLWEGKAGDAKYGVSHEEEVDVGGLTVSGEVSAEVGADPQKLLIRVGVESAQPVIEGGKAMMRRRIDVIEQGINGPPNGSGQ